MANNLIPELNVCLHKMDDFKANFYPKRENFQLYDCPNTSIVRVSFSSRDYKKDINSRLVDIHIVQIFF